MNLKTIRNTTLALCLISSICLAAPKRACRITQHFDKADSGVAYTLSKEGKGAGATVRDGALRLLEKDGADQNNAIAFDCACNGAFMNIEARFRLRMVEGADGGGFALLNTKFFGRKGAAPKVAKWEEPVIKGGFAVGFDVYDPPDKNWFKGSGNYMNYPQREISLHWNAVEVVKRLSDVEFRDGRFHPVAVKLRFVVGGAYASVLIDGQAIYQDYFIPEATPYECRPAFGARTGDLTTVFDIDDVDISFTRPAPAMPNPLRVEVFKGEIVDPKHKTQIVDATLPKTSLSVERVILTLHVAEP